MLVGIPAASVAGGGGHAVTPEAVARLVALGIPVQVETGGSADLDAFVAAGARLVDGPTLWSSSGWILATQPPSPEALAQLAPGAVVVCGGVDAADCAMLEAFAAGRRAGGVAATPGAGATAPTTVPARVWMPLVFVAACVLLGIGAAAPPAFLQQLTVFVLACLLGVLVARDGSPRLEAPRATLGLGIGGALVVAGSVQVSSGDDTAAALGAVAVALGALVSVAGLGVTARLQLLLADADGAP